VTIPTHKPVVVIGGGVMGSSLAYWLTRLEPTLNVTVLERDPSYTLASSALSAASIRQQFSTPVNIRVSQASIAFLRNAAAELGSDHDQPDIMLREHGYLYLQGPCDASHLRRTHTVWIKARPQQHMVRVIGQGDFRPMAHNREAMADLVAILEARAADYARAEATLDTSDAAVEQSCGKLRELVRRWVER